MGEKIKICDECGYENDQFADRCTGCGTVIDYIKAIDPDEHIQTIECCFLEWEDDPRISFKISDSAIVGRDTDITISNLTRSRFVSRKHARFHIEHDEWYIEDLGTEGNGATNGTFVNGLRLTPGMKKIILDGDRIILADTHFILRIRG